MMPFFGSVTSCARVSSRRPKVSISTMLPYKDVQNNAVFCDMASALGEASGIGDPNKRECPK